MNKAIRMFIHAPVIMIHFNPLSDNFTKWSNTLKQFVCNLPTNCMSVFDHFVGLALKGLTSDKYIAFLHIKSPSFSDKPLPVYNHLLKFG